MDKGVIYKASGDQYINEVIKSVKSLKKHNPDIPVTLLTYGQIGTTEYFDRVIQLDKPIESMGDSILQPSDIVYEKTLFLDSDTYICSDIKDISYLLERSDVAITFSSIRETKKISERLPLFLLHSPRIIVASLHCETIKK